MVRRNGRQEPATWDDALRVAEHTLRRLRESRGGVGVLGSGRATDQENFLAVTLARSALGTGNIDTFPAGSWNALAGAMRSAPADAVQEVERAQLVLVVEGDLAETHPRLASAALRAVQHGARLVTIGWAPTRMTEIAAAHLRLPVRAPASAFADLKAALVARRLDGGPANARTATMLADWLATSGRTVILFGVFDADTRLLAETAHALRTLTLYIKAAGGAAPVVVPLAPRANTRGAFEMGVTPDHLPGGKPLSDVATQQLLERLWGGTPSWAKGATAQEFVHSAAGLVVLCDDLVAHSDAPARMCERLEQLDCLVVIDAFMTPTARLAHVLFPAAAFGEIDGTVTSLDGRRQQVRSCSEPPAQAREGWRILANIAALLGSAFAPAHVGNVNEAIERLSSHNEDLARVRAPELPLEKLEHNDEVATRPLVLRLEGAFDWAMDPLVEFSPTLRRAAVSDRKLHRHGVVTISTEDAAVWQIREDGLLRLRSEYGEAAAAVHLRAGQEPGVLFVPYAFRDELWSVLAGNSAVDVEVIRT